jgi:N6-adenosine-specific RNA methylase IME4
MGRLFRNCHEICLIGTNSNKIYQQLQNRSQRTVSFAPNLKHSAKPENLQDSLELMFPNSVGKRLEIFGRRLRSGWDVIGNESPSTFNEDIFVSLQKLIDQ